MIKKLLQLSPVLLLLSATPIIADECFDLYAKLAVKNSGKRLKVNLSEASKFVLKTESGKEFLSSTGFKDVNELIKFIEQVDRPVNKLFRKHLLDKLHEIDGHVASFRGLLVKEGKMKAGKNTGLELTDDEKILVEILGQRLLRPTTEATEVLKNPTQISLKESKFFQDPPKALFDGTSHFKNVTAATGKQKQNIIKDGQFLYRGMRECVANQPKLEASFSKRAVTEALKQVAISETVTIGAAVTVSSADHFKKIEKLSVESTTEALTAGISEIRVKDLSINVLMTALSNGLGTFLLNGNAKISVRFLQATFFHESLDAIGAGIYVMTPAPENQYAAPVSDYYALNAAWGVGGTAAGVPVNLFLQGIACLYPNARWATYTNIATRIGYSIGINVLYFASADHFLYPEKPEEKK